MLSVVVVYAESLPELLPESRERVPSISLLSPPLYAPRAICSLKNV